MSSLAKAPPELLFLLCALVGLGFGFVVGRYRSERAFQNDGEVRLRRALLGRFTAPDYHLMNHVTLPIRDGSTQVDHILVSRFGVFVIETKDYSGWIFGDEKNSRWTQVIYRSKKQFQNPIFQNHRHVRAVQDLLDFLPADCVKSIVVFTGDAEFKSSVPRGVYDISTLVSYLGNQRNEAMSLNRVQFCVGRLETARLAITNETDVEHVQSLNRRFGRRDWNR